MKAIDYYNKYNPRLSGSPQMTDDDGDVIIELFIEFNREIENICETRSIKRVDALVAVLKEQNDKWNALCRIFEKKGCVSPIKPDGVKGYWRNQVPELKSRF